MTIWKGEEQSLEIKLIIFKVFVTFVYAFVQ